MDFANRGNRPTQAPQQSVNNEQPAPAFQPPAKKKRLKSINFTKVSTVTVLISSALLILAVVLGFIFFTGDKEENLIQKENYQAVFLDSEDGQVYFGRLDVYNKDLYRLVDIYYVRVENPIQPQGTEAQQPNISLAKLGNELHGPQDVMFISRDKVLYWENLKDDGQVVTAIKEFKENGSQTPTTQQQQQPANQEAAAPGAGAEEDADNSGAAGTQPAGTEEQNDTPGTPVTAP